MSSTTSSRQANLDITPTQVFGRPYFESPVRPSTLVAPEHSPTSARAVVQPLSACIYSLVRPNKSSSFSRSPSTYYILNLKTLRNLLCLLVRPSRPWSSYKRKANKQSRISEHLPSPTIGKMNSQYPTYKGLYGSAVFDSETR